MLPHPPRALVLALLTTLLTACPRPSGLDSSGDPGPGRMDDEQALGAAIAVEDLEAVPLGGLDTPYDDGSLPPLEGDRTALDLKSLVRSKLDYDIEMQTASLAELDDAGRDALLVHLAADPRWRVYEEEDVLVAARRVRTPRGWTVPNTGYHPGPDGPWRVLLRFGPLDDAHPWVTSPYVASVEADAGAVSVGGFVPTSTVYEGLVITALRVLGQGVSLDVYETSPEDTRPVTGDALAEVPPTVSNAMMLSDRLLANGHEPMMLPPPQPATRGLEIEGPAAGVLAWSARLNPEEPGWVWLRLVKDGAPWEEIAVAGSTRERIGYAPGSARTFLAESRFPVPVGPAFQATAEVWFLPDRGDARVLRSETVRVPAR